MESINLKNNYIKQKKLGGAFFWELSSDRQAELISATLNALDKRIFLSTTTRPSLTSPSTDKIQSWKAKVKYKLDQYVIYQGKIYRCIKTHKSLPKKTPDLKNSYWNLETKSTCTTTTTKSLTQDSISEWKSYKLYSVGDEVTYQGKQYRCRQSHTSLSDWMPPVVPALWWQV